MIKKCASLFGLIVVVSMLVGCTSYNDFKRGYLTSSQFKGTLNDVEYGAFFDKNKDGQPIFTIFIDNKSKVEVPFSIKDTVEVYEGTKATTIPVPSGAKTVSFNSKPGDVNWHYYAETLISVPMANITKIVFKTESKSVVELLPVASGK